MEDKDMYEKMKKELLIAVKNMLPTSFKIKTFNVFKNGNKVEAFLISEEDSDVSPTFYFNDYLDDYTSGVTVEHLAKKTVAFYFFASQQVPACINVDSFNDFNTQKDRIVYKAVNAEQYASQLPTLPHIDFFDLAIIFYCIIDIREDGIMSYLISNETLETWGISKEILCKIARENLPKMLPLEICALGDAINGRFNPKQTVEEAIDYLGDELMYVVTNKYKKYGFVNIFYPGLLETFAERFGSIYIIPSSVEEAILIPAAINIDIVDIKQIVKEVNGNKNIVQPDVFLSNSVYYYDAVTGKFDASLATTKHIID